MTRTKICSLSHRECESRRRRRREDLFLFVVENTAEGVQEIAKDFEPPFAEFARMMVGTM